MKKRFRLIVKLSIGMIVGFSIFVGCEKQDEIISEDSIANTEDFASEGKMMILGKQLKIHTVWKI